MNQIRFGTLPLICCAAMIAAAGQNLAASTLCVKPSGSGGCYSTIQMAVNQAAANDVIKVEAGTYKEDVVVGIPLTLKGAGAGHSVIDATGLANGVYIDGYDHPGLNHVTLAGFTVKNAKYEGVLVVNAANVTIRNNTIKENDKFGPVFTGQPGGCAGQPEIETDESGDCGGGLHLMGAVRAIVSDNLMTENADGILISDETGESHDNLLIHNVVKDNQLECGIVLASHPPVGSAPPYFATHNGVDRNAVAENVSADNGVKVGGSGVGLFSDGNGPGRVSENVVVRNTLTGNGIGGVNLHTHVGPMFGAPADDMDGNIILGNYIANNLADTDDTRTPGKVGININSGGGGSPVTGTIISENEIHDEDVDIAINTPAPVDIHLNNLYGGHIGVANICAFDGASCAGSVNASENYWGCSAGPGTKGCSSASGPNVTSAPWVHKSVSLTAASAAGAEDQY